MAPTTVPLYHCQVRPDMLPSGSLRLAVTGTTNPNGCVLDSLTVPSSSSFSTVTFTAIVAPILPSVVWRPAPLPRIRCSVFASVGASKSGVALNVSSPAAPVADVEACCIVCTRSATRWTSSAPVSLRISQPCRSPSSRGDVVRPPRRKVTVASPALATAGGSFTLVTVMFTVISSLLSATASIAWGTPAGSVALTVTV